MPRSTQARKSDAPTSLGARLKIALGRYTGTKAELARLCEVTPPAVQKWFGGDVETMEARALLRVAQVCRVNPYWLAFGTPASLGTKPAAGGGADGIGRIEYRGTLAPAVRAHVEAIIAALASADPSKGRR